MRFRDRQPLFQNGQGAVAWTPGMRLPEGRFWMWTCDQGPASVRLVYGSTFTTPPLETLAASAFSALHVHPGHDVYVQTQAPVGAQVAFFVVE